MSITSYGSLPHGLPPEDFGKVSVQRNSLIASLLLRVHYIEKIGTGIRRIKDDVARLGKGEVNFEFNSRFFIVTFTRNPYKSNTDAAPIVTTHKLTPLQKKILNLFKLTVEEYLTNQDIHDKLNNMYSIRFLRIELLGLRNMGYIDYVGETRSRQWFLVNK